MTVARATTLRGRLLTLLVAVVVVLAVAMGALSAVALRDSLIGQLDATLTAAAGRGEVHGGRGPGGPGASATDRPGWQGGRGQRQAQDDAQDGDADHDDQPPGGLAVPGQQVGTLMLVDSGDAVRGAYLDGTGATRALTEDQAAALHAVRADGRPRTVHVPGLGDHRALSVTTGDGSTQVTALPMGGVNALTRRFLLSELAVALAVAAAAVLVGRRLVARELAPLERVAGIAGRVAGRTLDRGEVAVPERVPAGDLGGTREVAQVGTALNALLDNVEESLAARHASETQVRRFVADASHELRTPLASVRGYAELVRRRENELPEDARHALTRIESESRRMTALVEDMLLLARLDAGRDLRRDEVDLAVLAVDATTDAHAAAPGHRFALDLPEVSDPEDGDWPEDGGGAGDGAPTASGERPGEPVVLGDEDRLRQVLANLLANARLHTPPGTTVRVGVRRAPGPGGAGADAATGAAGAAGPERVVVTVADDGPGIDAELLPRLFDRFARGDTSRARGGTGAFGAGATGSTGLGLSIVRAVVEAHGGTVAVASSPAGTTVTVDLPAAPSS